MPGKDVCQPGREGLLVDLTVRVAIGVRSGGVCVRVQRVGRGAGLRLEVLGRLTSCRVLELGVVRVVKHGRGQRRRQDAAPDHVHRRVHAAVDAALAEVRRTGQ